MSNSNTAKIFVDRALLLPLVIDGGDLPATVDKLRDLIAASGRFYDRDGPVEVVFDPTGTPVINKLTKNNVVYIAHELCRPMKVGNDGKLKAVTLPERVAQMYLDLRGKWNLPLLSGISTAPLLKEDGSIYSAQGYDQTTKLWCYKIPKLNVIEKPTREDAEAALLILRHTFRTFSFADSPRKLDDKLGVEVVDLSQPPGLDESTFLTALLTAVCRQSLWLSPGLLINAPALSGAGSGKGLLVRSIAMTAYGTHVTPFPPGNDKHEMDKRIVADVLQGRPSLFMDNVNGTTLRSNTLCILLTERPASIRILGVSRMVQLDQAMFVAVTGNGLTISEDLGRRFLVVEFDTGLENPELRPFGSGFLNTIEADRNKLLAAALTIWRWGRQHRGIARGTTLGSFERWGEWVRDPLLALGCQDPVKRVRDIKERDPERQRILEIFTKWHEMHGTTAMRVSELDDAVKRAIDPQDHGRQFQARAVGNLVGTRLAGYVLKRFGAGNSRKEGAQYNLEYRQPGTKEDQPENLSACDGHCHPHHPQNAQEQAKDTAHSDTSEVRMTARMTRRFPADDCGCPPDAPSHPQVIRTQENGWNPHEIRNFANRGERNADDADEIAHPRATQKIASTSAPRALIDIEAAYQELAEREANSTSGNCIYCGKKGAEPRLCRGGLWFHPSCREGWNAGNNPR